jgi:hypothetical protein
MLNLSGGVFEGNATLTYGGGAIQLRDSAVGTIESTEFLDNSAIGCIGGAIALFTGANAEASNCTLYRNSAWAGGGLGLFQGATATISNSIIASSIQGQALFCGDVSAATLSCSDVFGNVGGDWTACIAGQLGFNGNLHEDPLFCDGPSGDLGLAADSPCAPGNSLSGCNLIGALPVGCGTTEVADTGSPSSAILTVFPNPVRGVAQFALPERGSEPIEIFNPRGELIERLVMADGRAAWTPGASVPEGVYFARVGTGKGLTTTKFLYIR